LKKLRRSKSQRLELLESQEDSILELAGDDDAADRPLERLLRARLGGDWRAEREQRDDETPHDRARPPRSPEHAFLPVVPDFTCGTASGRLATRRRPVKVSSSTQCRHSARRRDSAL
jgi:hypothetical protein